jgi:hypothetical protein
LNQALQRTPAPGRDISDLEAWWPVAGAAELGRSAREA